MKKNIWQDNATISLDVEDNVVETDTAGNSTRNIFGTSDQVTGVGYICGVMGDDCSLTVNSVSAENNTSYSVTAKSGSAGGVVGSMGDGSTLVLNCELPNSSATVTAAGSGSYAGGIVGKNDGGTVVLGTGFNTSDHTYSISNTLNGVAGAGAVFGYYRPAFTVDQESGDKVSEFDISYYALNATANGTGSVGGLFGVLENMELDNGVDMAGGHITLKASGAENKTVTVRHGSGDMDHYGGLIGKYTARQLSDSLLIDSVGTSMARSDGSYSNFGGGIGKISGTSHNADKNPYVKFSDFTATVTGGNGANRYFGGMVASSDNAFVDAYNVTVSSAGNYHGAGLVGQMEDGILRLSGYTTFTGTGVVAGDSYYEGQIVGYRDNSLVFAENGWRLNRGSAVLADDIGSWGEVICFHDDAIENADGSESPAFSRTAVLAVDEDAHTVQILAPSVAYTEVHSVTDFAKTAFCFQLKAAENPELAFVSDSYTFETIRSANISLEADIDLRHTGLTGFTRDNASTNSLTAAYCVYTGTFNGKGHKLTLATGEPYGYRSDEALVSHAAEGNGRIYRHIYNGLFAIVSNAEINNISFAGTVDVTAKRGIMYVGAAAARAKDTFASDSVNVNISFSQAGNETIYMGGLLGEDSSEIGSIDINRDSTSGTYTLDITGDNSKTDTCIGGVIGRISHGANAARVWNISNVTLSGSIENTAAKGAQRLGGLIAAISSYEGKEGDYKKRILTLDGIEADDLTISGNVGGIDNATMGGLLGYSWYNTDVVLADVDIRGTSEVTVVNSAGYGNLAGLVYAATGKWTVTDLDIDAIKISSSARVHSFGMIVNTGWNLSDSNYSYTSAQYGSAIYMLLPTTGCYQVTSAVFGENFDADVYDEIVAYSAYYRTYGNKRLGCVSGEADKTDDLYILKNGAGVVSIHTDAETASVNSGLIMNGTSSSMSYAAQTSKGNVPNPYTRYYYNLDTVTSAEEKNLTTPQKKLMSWGLHTYAHSSIKDNFAVRLVRGRSHP